MMFYLIVLGLPTYEIWKGHNDSVRKEQTLDKRLTSLEEGTEKAALLLEETLE